MNVEYPEKSQSKRSTENEEQGHPAIDLEPLSIIDTPRYVVHETGDSYSRDDMPLAPIPERPLHLCPTCNYNLTGLTRYRCPECGNRFTLNDARIQAIEQTTRRPLGQLFLVVIDAFGTPFGLLCVLAAAIVPNAVAGGFDNWPITKVTLLGLLSWILLGFLFLQVWFAQFYIEWPKARIILVAGLLALGIMAILIIL